MQLPPLLPEEVLARVLRLARFDGLGILVLGAFFAVSAALARDLPFAAVGLLAAGAGAVELHGVALLWERQHRGMRWIIASQPLLLIVILGYCVLRITHFEMPTIPARFEHVFELGAQQWNLSVEEYLRMMNRLTAQVVAVVSILYQGGMMLYYLRRLRPVERAIIRQRAE